MQDMARGEGIAIPIALIVLIAVFGISLAVGMPFLLAACSIGGTLGDRLLASYFQRIPQQVINMVELVGLGSGDRLLAPDRLPLPRGAREG